MSHDSSKDKREDELSEDAVAETTETSETMRSGDEAPSEETTTTETSTETDATEASAETDATETTVETSDANRHEETLEEQSDRHEETHETQSDHHDDSRQQAHDDEFVHQGSGFAGNALKFLLIVVGVFMLAAWLLPMAAPHMPAAIAKHLMPGQQLIDERLANLDSEIGSEIDTATEKLAAMQASLDEMATRLSAAEAEAAEARAAAAEAVTAAAESAGNSTTVSDAAVTEIRGAAENAATAAEAATTAAAEAGKAASAASRDAATLARRMTGFEARIDAMSEEISALTEGMASVGTGGEGPSSAELGAAFSALQARVEGLGVQLSDTSSLLTQEDAQRFVTQDDLRTARTALETNLEKGLDALPDPAAIATLDAVDAVKTELGGQIGDLDARIGAVEATASTAEEQASVAVGKVETAIQNASVRSAVAALMSRMQNGAAFSDSLDELEKLTGVTAPDALRAGAGAGLATSSSLLRGFGRTAQAAQAADIKANADEGILGQTSARLKSLVAGRPKSEQPGEDIASILSRIEGRLKDGALAEALTEADALSEPAKGAISDWMGRLKARVEADAAAQAYVTSVREQQG